MRALVVFVGAALAGTAVHLAMSRPAHTAGQVQTTRISDGEPPVVISADVGAVQNEPAASRSHAWLLAEGPAPVPGDGRRYVTLSFDDGPFPETTPAVLKLLDKHHVRATFFVIGKNLEGDTGRDVAVRKAAREIEGAGHVIGSHTYTHALLTSISHTRVLDEIDEGVDAITRTLGHKPTLFRPPYGQVDDFGEGALAERHLGLVMWSVEVGDMKERDEDSMFERLCDQLDFAGGGLVLLHDAHWPTVHVLGRLLAWLDARRFDPDRPERPGFVVVDLEGYMRETRLHPQPFASRKDLEDARAQSWRTSHPQKI